MSAPPPTPITVSDPSGSRIQEAIRLMMSFAERTGLTSDRPQQRYLWTDAFAVCNFLGIGRATGEAHYTEMALRLVDRVHQVLGRHRADDSRAGWISGLGEQAGMAHPTRGGLRIGKKLPERRPGEPFDEALEWERDGQYFHYLTKWMHALDQVSRATSQPRFNLWARELAEAAFGAFSILPPGGRRPRMVWKMSIDLSRPLVTSMGHHDPLDGFITCAQLQATASGLAGGPDGPSLKDELSGFASMTEGRDWATTDPLGIGGLLVDACRVEQLMAQGALPDGDLLCTLLAGALDGLGRYAESSDLRRPASRRLAFRELGLAIGLHAVELIEIGVQAEPGRFAASADLGALLGGLRRYVSLRQAIESFWLDQAHREARGWAGHCDIHEGMLLRDDEAYGVSDARSAHRDINEVMLATSLIPEGLLVPDAG